MTDRRAARKQAEARGRRGELLAAVWLMLRGWRILARRVRVAGGEVDLVARRGRVLAMVEVKQRARDVDLDTAIDAHRLTRVAAAAGIIAPRFQRPGDDIRIDVMLVQGWTRIRRIENAWQP